jgi:L-glyceraldehyde 3-phosphate reductase
LLNRWIEGGLTDVLRAEGIGCIAFSPLAQGLLTNKYLDGIPADSRAAEGDSFDPAFVNEANIDRVRGLRSIADGRGQSLAQMALSWVLRDDVVTSALIGASRWEQIAECIGALEQTAFSDEELAAIDEFAVDAGVNLWAESSNAG